MELGGFALVRPLTSGAGGVRFVARDRIVGDLVVVKCASDADGRSAVMVRHEAVVLARLDGVAGVVPLRATGTTPDGRPYLVGAYRGRSLHERLAERREVRPDDARWPEVLEAAAGLAHTLAAVHRRGVLHLDVTPANVCESRTEGPAAGWTLVDFGRATLADTTGVAGGTGPFAAPEHRVGAPATAAADTYGWAATVWTVVCGTPPFGADDSDLDVRIGHLPPGPAPRWLPAPVLGVLAASLRVDPARRPDPGKVAALLQEVAASARGARRRRAPRLPFSRGGEPR